MSVAVSTFVRSAFLDEHASLRRRRLLLLLLVVAAFAAFLALVTELATEPDPLTLVAGIVGFAATAFAARAVVLIGRDERRRLADAEATIDLTDSLLIVVDRGSRVALANPAACRVFGRDEDAMLGQEIQTFFEPEVRGVSRKAFRDIIAGTLDPSTHRTRRVIVRPDGSTRVIDWHVAPRRDARGAITSLLVSGDDITQREAEEALRRREREDLEQLQALLRDVARSDDARRPVVERVQALTDAAFVGLGEPAGDGSGDWEFSTATNDWLSGQRIPAGSKSGTLIAVKTREPLFVADSIGDSRVSRALNEGSGARSLLFQPILEDDRCVGVLVAGWTRPQETMDERRQQVLALAAAEATIALERRRTMEQLRTAALQDSLTGLPNRRAFDMELPRAIARAQRTGRPLTLAVMDLNEFKLLNDRDGHQAGDALLAGCAGSWEGVLRRGDVLCRLGGDEFAAILPECDAAHATALVQRLRDATPHAPGASIGHATWDGESPHDLYQLADHAQYADKAGHRAARLTDPERLAAVEATGLWDAGDRSEEIGALAAEAEALLQLPVYVNLVGAEALQHVACPPDTASLERDFSISLCQHVVTSGKAYVVGDTRDGSAAGEAVAATGLVAYAGTPLAGAGGAIVGAVCAGDGAPHEWAAAELRVLDRLAERVSAALPVLAA